PDTPFIADAKRGDIGSTAARQAVALFDTLGADAVTASPYLGVDAIEPLLAGEERFVYVLCRTSNPGASELQDRLMAADADGAALPLYLQVAHLVAGWGNRYPRVGLVVGATAPAEMALVRAAAPELPFLVPGVGAQGGDGATVLEYGPATAGVAAGRRGGALLVNVSRGIAGATAGQADAAAALLDAAQHWAALLRC
ncbi:MAG TPA: orotidine-5'-phosphate decarboxylase, partial [Candidatus Caenarcaniphilales bacterium]|nr:orotidine-5'-phosphate decarboxylase [Candidatus Caenarcaniphilales bacterium]